MSKFTKNNEVQTEDQTMIGVKILRLIFIMGILGSLGFSILAGSLYWHFSRGLPNIITVEDYRPLIVTRIIGSKTGPKGPEPIDIGEFYVQRRYLIPYEKISQNVIHAFISAEDDRFFEHSGFNLLSILRAGIANFKAGHVVQGGSTITQQVAKSLLLTPEKSFDRKIKEIILANRIERHLTKEQILYLYLNQIYLGHGSYGVQAAARTYFRKDAFDLSIAEAALIAGLPQAPSKYSPILNPKKAKERQLYVLRRMYENHWITEAQMKQAAVEAIPLYHSEDLNQIYAPYWVEHIRRYLVEQYGENAVNQEGLTVTVPCDVDIAKAATRSLQEGLRAVDKRIGFRGVIQHLKGQDEIDDFLSDQRLQLIDEKVHFQMLLPEGRLDSLLAMSVAGIKHDRGLLEEGKLYKAVVIGLEPNKKNFKVMIGASTAELPIDEMKWAHLTSLNRGDVIWVSLLPQTFGQTSDPTNLRVTLEQQPQIQGALVSMDIQTGFITAMVGGYDFNTSEFNRATQAIRQLGSVYKPIIYSAALEKGYTPTTVIVDSPIVFKNEEEGTSWKPSNFEEKFYGDTTFRHALIKSRNIPTVKIVQSIQIPYLIDYSKRLGLNAQFKPDLSIALGSGSTSLLDLMKVYALFPRLGRKVTPLFFGTITDREGKILKNDPPRAVSSPHVPSPSPSTSPTFPLQDDPDQVLDPRVAFSMTHLMKEVVNYGTGVRAKSLGRPAAGKTGTTNDAMDTWFVGFTPQILTGVWVGFDTQKSIGPGETGAKVALPIWLDFMKNAVKDTPSIDFPIPPGITFVSIDPITGRPTSDKMPGAILEAFIEGTEPSESANPSSLSNTNQSDFFKEDRE